jgi:hypothetical protein
MVEGVQIKFGLQLSDALTKSQPFNTTCPCAFKYAFWLRGLTFGGVLSKTETAKEHDRVNPTASVTVYVTVVRPTGNKLPGACEDVTVMPPQLSEAVGSQELANRLTLDGQLFNHGRNVSITSTTCLNIRAFPRTSVSVKSKKWMPLDNNTTGVFTNESATIEPA